MMDEIPFKCVPYDTWIKLANKLDPEMPVNGNNWRILAHKLGYSTEEILVLECKQAPHGRNTIKFFEEYVKKSGSTVEKMQEALEQMERPDALNILLEALPKIQNNHEVECEKTRERQLCQERQDQAIENGTSVSFSTDHSHETWEHFHGRPNKRKSPLSHGMPEAMLAKQAEISPNYPINASPRVLNSADLPLLQQGMPQGSPTHSMLVNIDDRSLGYHSMKVDDMDTSPQPENPVPLALGMYRGEHHLASLQHSPFPNNVEVSKTPSPNANYYPVYERSDLNCQSPPHRFSPDQKMDSYHRQISEERNFKQPLHDPKNPNDHSKLTLNFVRGGNDENVFSSPSPTTPGGGNHLDKLKQIVTLERFKPDKEFNIMIKEKHEEELLQQRMQSQIPRIPVKEEKCYNSCGCNKNSGNFFTNSHHRYKDSSRCQAPKETSKTFPMRIRSSTTDGSPKESSKQVGLVKSVSMPNDMKPAECHKAFRQIQVFVTYAADTHRHIQRVLNLCNCLEKNGFSCCMDIYHRRLQMEDRLGWFDERFKEADFILVCVSSKYKAEVEEHDVREHSVNENCLHTKYIYKLMQSEFVRNKSTNSRFIPLLFDTASLSDVPSWLQNTLIYKWPHDWKDLMWMLTKPEERIKPRTKSYFQNSNQLNS